MSKKKVTTSVTTVERTRKESCTVSFSELAEAARNNRLTEILSVRDEVTFALTDGRMVTLVCGYVNDGWARLVFKDCLCERPMNKTEMEKSRYYESTLRQYLLNEIYPLLPDDLKKIIIPRTMIEHHDGRVCEYADPLWLLSATDVFGPSEDWSWAKEEDSFQLPIFTTWVDRVKATASGYTRDWWTRSPTTKFNGFFKLVLKQGHGIGYGVRSCMGVAPGLDIGQL